MPVRYSKDGEVHERDDYTFRTGDYGSRDFARMRRFGGDEPEDSRTMSLVSSPLQLPMVGKRRSVSPSHRSSPAPHQASFEADDDLDEEILNIQRQNRRQSLERRRYNAYNYDDYDDEKLEPLVPTFQPRSGRSSQRSLQPRYESPLRYAPRRRPQSQLPEEYEEEYDEPEIPRSQQQQFRAFLQQQQREKEEEARQTPPRRARQPQQEELDGGYRWRKREPSASNGVGYVVPPLRKRTDPELQNEDESIRSVAGYLAKRKQFAVEDDEEMTYHRNPNYQYRMLGGGDRPMISNRDVEESIKRGKLEKAPMFDMKLRSHNVWEKMNVKFTCTVRGHPMPRVTWYKDMVPLEPSLHNPGKYKISHTYGLHTLEICRTSIEDSGTYRVSLQNRKGEISSYATLVVRRYDGGKMGVVDMRSGYNLRKPTDYPDVEGLNVPEKKPHVGDIKVEEYDELPDTDAGRHFKSQLENLDFDVKQLIKEAKLEKDIASSDTTADTKPQIEAPPSKSVTFADDVIFAAQKSSDPVTFNASTDTTVGGVGEERASDSYITNLSKTDSDSGGEQQGKNRYKVELEVKVTNESRRDSEPYLNKTFDIEQDIINKNA